MTIEQTNVVDFIGIEADTNSVILAISDHLDSKFNEENHVELLRNKINNYLEYIESGEIYVQFPKYKGKKIVISIAHKYQITERILLFYRNVGITLKSIGVEIRYFLL
ncbi:MAG: hypothetical protein IPP74_08680 [Alphaproteobacteria bacterium]|nr:hypothetical protein [Alphaproteobacteria bacterium]